MTVDQQIERNNMEFTERTGIKAAILHDSRNRPATRETITAQWRAYYLAQATTRGFSGTQAEDYAQALVWILEDSGAITRELLLRTHPNVTP